MSKLVGVMVKKFHFWFELQKGMRIHNSGISFFLIRNLIVKNNFALCSRFLQTKQDNLVFQNKFHISNR